MAPMVTSLSRKMSPILSNFALEAVKGESGQGLPESA